MSFLARELTPAARKIVEGLRFVEDEPELMDNLEDAEELLQLLRVVCDIMEILGLR